MNSENIQKIIEESEIKDLIDSLFQLRYQYDSEYEALDGNTGSFWGNDKVKKLLDDIIQKIRQETLDEVERKIDHIKDIELPHKTKCTVGQIGLVCNCGIDDRIAEKNKTLNDIIKLIKKTQIY